MNFFDLNKKSIQWITLLFLAFIWGSSFILMKRGLDVYSHNEVAALRISLAFIVMLPFAFKTLKKVSFKYWKYIFIVGLFGNFIPAFLFTKAQTEISSALTGMLNSLTPVFALLIALFVFKAKIKKIQSLGVFIGLIGATGLIIANGIDISNSNIEYTLFIVAATICYAISVNVIKNNLKEIDSVAITALAFFMIGPWSIIYLFTTNFLSTTSSNPNALISLGYIAILSILGTALAVIIFNMLIKKTTTIFATSVTYLIPIVAILWGVIDNEIINIYHLISIAIIFLGVYFINKIS
jgi:drug/metabolite transporter (DMT)-like permease